MSEQTSIGRGAGALKRRGMLTGAAALAAALVAKLGTPERAQATHGAITPGVTQVPGIDSLALHVGTTNSAADTTRLAANGGGADGALLVSNAGGTGVVASVSGPNTGLVASAGSGVGVQAQSTSNFGLSAASQSGVGVFGGSGSNYGVYANSNADTGVFATAPQKGIWGRTTTGIGVLAQAIGAAPSAVGVLGVAAAPGWAGYFEGNVFVTGRVFTAAGGVLTTAQAADGSQRALYSVDSAEPLVEDVGEGTLVGGKVEVALDADFVAVADGGAYQVFLTPYADLGGAFVAARTPTSFAVRSPTGATGGFGYRVVATPKGAAGQRLEKGTPPKKLDAKDLEPRSLPAAPRAEPPRPGRQDAR